MYRVYKVESHMNGKRSVQVGEPVDEKTAIKRVSRLGGYATHAETKKLLCQNLFPNGIKFLKTSVASGEDVCLN